MDVLELVTYLFCVFLLVLLNLPLLATLLTI